MYKSVFFQFIDHTDVRVSEVLPLSVALPCGSITMIDQVILGYYSVTLIFLSSGLH